MEKTQCRLAFAWFLFLVIPLVFVATGCSEKSVPVQRSISVSPEILDFGKVRPTDSPIRLTFELRNDGDQSVVIDNILVGCACAFVDLPQEPIPPGGKVAVAVSVNIWGRAGLFEDDLIVRPAVGDPLRVPVRGSIETDIWTVGQALRSTIGQTEQRTSAILTVFTVKYPDIVFADGQQENGVTLTEISRVTQNGETAIRFSVEIDIDCNSAVVMRSINLIPADPSIAPLMIPFYGHRE